MKINGINNLDVGMSNIEIEGSITYTKDPRHVEGDNERGHYDFWSQFIVIDDGTGKIGCNCSIAKEEYMLKVGVVAKVKGKLEQYEDKNGEIQKSIRCSLVGISEEDKTTDAQQKTAEGYFEDKTKEEKKIPIREISENVREENELRIVREVAIKASTELVCAKVMKSKDFFTFSNTIVKYIYNGQIGDKEQSDKEEKIGLSRHIVEGEKLEVREGHENDSIIDEEKIIDDEENEPGSSPDNAIPYKGKEKKLKKISGAEDFIVEENIPE